MMARQSSLRLAALAAALVPALALVGCGTAPQQEPAAPAHVPVKPGAKPQREPGVPVLPPAGSGKGGYYQDDGPGDNPPPNLLATPDAEVRNEPPIPRANKEYAVFGKTYRPITDPDQPFVQRGLGTWYGKKFHGQRTSSGELYDMYKMTAAHPTLPIPSYARVTNLDNGNQVVVRVNDRGPFHSTRIIDVSYTAALKLGLLGKGSHMLEVERILPAEADKLAAANKSGAKPATVLRPQAPMPQREPAQTAALLYPAPPTANAGTVAQTAVGAGQAVAAQVAVPAADGVMLAGGATVQASSAIVPAVATVSSKGGFYLQLGAYAKPENAEAARAKVAMESGLAGLEVVPSGAVLRLYGGPFATRQEAEQAMQALPASLGLKPLVIQR
ncbi:septal ring lytic transglycosylase RlpA family protein [Pseudoduganella rivuli]|nr:septal ring lytic transglycosylase RlpA family protein [Pseudoduganella rivuli]